MKAMIVPIGNSKGVRIPKAVLEQCRIKREILLEVDGERIIISPLRHRPRQGWEERFQAMHLQRDDRPIMPDSLDLAAEDWQW